jgi:diguanylate cyclase (GGDEF)-like protein
VRVLMWMQPRSRPAAIRTLVTLGVVAAVVTFVFLPVQPGRRDPTMAEAALTLAAAAVVVAACWLARTGRIPSLVAWALGPLLALAAIVVVDLLTSDASVAAQIFFFFPVLYGASQLPRAGAFVMAAASVVGVVVVVVTLLPFEEALIDIGYVSAALVTTAVILIRSGERQAELVANLERLAAMDPLTGLVTRRVLDEAAKSAISGAASVAGTSLILLDIDNFKSINDRHGHPGGDEVLIQLADLLVESARHDDVVCRIGGDEMALLLPGCSVSTLRGRAQQIVQDVRARRFVLSGGQEATVSVSVGLAHAPTDAVDLPSLYVKADQTLYDAKRFGRNRVGIVADSTALLPAPEPSAWDGPELLERMIRTALDNESIQLAYQPIIDLNSGLLVAVEALLRLTDEAGRPLPAQEVISAAEASGLIAELGRRVIQVAARQSAQWRADHGVLLPIAVNVSAAQVGQPAFPRDILEAVEQAGVPPEALWIELTESVLLETGSHGMAQLRELSDAGVPLAIDDFGTGYASLSLLHALPACTIKIDQSFVAGIPDDHRAVAIVAGVIDMARNFDMTCIAEGIESDTQRSYLAERGVLGQGYLLGRPDDAAAIEQIIARGRTSPSLSAV